jgi:hypothetical protein
VSDLPYTAAKVFQYADDVAVTYQAKNNLEADIEVLNQFSRLPLVYWPHVYLKVSWLFIKTQASPTL